MCDTMTDILLTDMVWYRGVHAVHYLMFSDHVMVRRAAAEVFCNMSTNEAVLVVCNISFLSCYNLRLVCLCACSSYDNLIN